jgi:hypothetical protein
MENIVDVVQKLLAKAERAGSEAEAETFFAKATELMTKYAIDSAQLQSLDSHVKAIHVILRVHGPYAKAKAHILDGVAGSYNCELVANPRLAEAGNLEVHLFGYESDINAVKSLYNSLLIFAMREAGRGMRRNPQVHGKTFCQSFYLGFSVRIAARLAETRQSALADTETSKALVFVGRKKDATDLQNATFGRLGKTRLNNRSHEGWSSGHNAANTAPINKNLSGSQKALDRN